MSTFRSEESGRTIVPPDRSAAGALQRPRSRRRPLPEQIASGLRDDILSARVAPGDRIAELEMAERFGTSQAPVREAFALLRREGLLISLPNRGTFVTTVSEADAFLAYQVRILIEPRIAALALPALTATDRVAMWEDVEAMASAAAQSDLQAFTERDMAFHGRLYERSADMLGARIWMSISSTVRQFMSAAGGRFVDDLDLADVASMHRRLLDHVDRHDAASLADELTRHLTADWDVLSQPTRQEGLPK